MPKYVIKRPVGRPPTDRGAAAGFKFTVRLSAVEVNALYAYADRVGMSAAKAARLALRDAGLLGAKGKQMPTKNHKVAVASICHTCNDKRPHAIDIEWRSGLGAVDLRATCDGCGGVVTKSYENVGRDTAALVIEIGKPAGALPLVHGKSKSTKRP